MSLEDEAAAIYMDVTPTGDTDTKLEARLKEFKESMAAKVNEVNLQVVPFFSLIRFPFPPRSVVQGVQDVSAPLTITFVRENAIFSSLAAELLTAVENEGNLSQQV